MTSKPAKIIGIISIVAGLLMMVAGVVTWNIVTSQLKDERITVPADAAKEKGIDDLNSTDPAVQSKIEGDPELKALKGELAKYTVARNTNMNGAFLRSSLFSSVITYGVAALVVGLGLMFALLGYALVSLKAARATDVSND